MSVDRAARGAEGADQVEGLAAELRVLEFAGDAQHAVAQGFEIQAPAMGAPVQGVVGILGDGVVAEVGGLQERARKDDRADELLRRPTALDERGREVIEEGGVLAGRGADSEVARGLDERLAEEVHPDTVDHHAGGQRVGRASDGVGEVEAAAALGEFLGRAVGEDGKVLARDLLARAGGAAAEEDDALHGLRLVLDRHRVRRTLRARGLEAGHGDLQVVAGIAVGDVVGADERGRCHGRGSAGMEDEFTPDLPLGSGGMLGLAGLGEQGGVRRGQLGQFDGGLGLQPGAEERVGELGRLGDQSGEALRELLVRDALKVDPGAPDRVGRRELGPQRILPSAEHGRIQVRRLGLLIGVELGVLEGLHGQVEIGQGLLRREGEIVAALDEVIELLLTDAEFGFEFLRLFRARERLQRREFLGLFAGIEDRVEGVIFGRRERIKLVVVAAGARHRQALGAAHDDVDTVVDDVGGAVEETATEGQEAQRGEVAVVLRILDDLVGGDLQAEELVVGEVVVEGLHDPIAIGIGVGVAAFFLEDVALRVGVAGHVEPVSAPAFAEGRRREQAIDQLLEGLRVLVGDEGGDLGGGRLIADERKGQATDDDFTARLRVEVEAGLLELGQDEAVERLADLGGVGFRDRRRSRRDDRLEGPMLAGILGERLGFLRPREALTHPLGERGDGLGRKLLVFAGHGVHVRSFGVIDREDQAADFGLAGDDDRADFAALEDELARIETEAGLLFLLAMAFKAMIGQDRPHFLFEMLQLGGRGRRRRLRRPGRCG